MDSRTSRLYNTFNLSSMTNYMHIYDPYSTINANGGFSIGASTSITLLPSTSIIHFDGVNNRVGIGTTAPSATLSVNGASYFSSSVTIAAGNFLLGGTSRLLYSNDSTVNNIYSGGSDGLRVMNQADSAVLMTITNGGNVGIGTISPTNNLSILGADQTSNPTLGTNAGKFGIFNGTGSGTYGMIMGVINNGNSYIQVQRIDGTATAYNLLLQPSGGNVGIGIATANPNVILEVGGLVADVTKSVFRCSLGAAPTAYFNDITAIYSGASAQANKLQINYANGYTSGTGIVLQGDGNIGMGTTTPNTKLDVNGQINVRTNGFEFGRITTNNTTSNIGGLTFQYNASGTFTTGMSLNGSGVVSINNLGSGTVTATSGVLSAVSDMNLKDEDGFIDNALEKVLKLKPRYYHWKEESGLPTDLRQLGFYAQEVNEALGEEAANTPKTENDKWGIYDRGMIAFLTKAIQEQQAQIEAQQQQINSLINR